MKQLPGVACLWVPEVHRKKYDMEGNRKAKINLKYGDNGSLYVAHDQISSRDRDEGAEGV